MAAPQEKPAHARAPRVEEGTDLALDKERARAFQEQVAALRVDPALWTGAFATHVWGGRYEMEGVLGAGGQGTTFVGTDRKTGARVVVKVLDLAHAQDWKRVDLFDREVRALKALEHAGMPRFLDVLEDPQTGARALVMTHVPGQTLEEVLREEGPLSEAALWRVLLDVVDVLKALHGQPSPMVHRDIKPRNLIRRPDGTVAVVDFGSLGLARREGGTTVVGTFGYMAPEQLYGQALPATDLYALGATLLTLATGKEPEKLPRKGLSIDVDEAAPHLSETLRALLSRLIEADPENRPADARALARELQELFGAPQKRRRRQEPARAQDAEEAIEGALEQLAGLVSLVLGVLGTVAVVAIGEVILPVLLTLLMAFASEDGKRRLAEAKKAVRTGARAARETFKESARHGARTLQKAQGQRRPLPSGKGKRRRGRHRL